MLPLYCVVLQRNITIFYTWCMSNKKWRVENKKGWEHAVQNGNCNITCLIGKQCKYSFYFLNLTRIYVHCSIPIVLPITLYYIVLYWLVVCYLYVNCTLYATRCHGNTGPLISGNVSYSCNPHPQRLCFCTYIKNMGRMSLPLLYFAHQVNNIDSWRCNMGTGYVRIIIKVKKLSCWNTYPGLENQPWVQIIGFTLRRDLYSRFPDLWFTRC